MILDFWLRNNGAGPYCEGDPTGETNIVFTTQMPTDSIYNWDIPSQTWLTTIDNKRTWIRPQRNMELARTDKYMLSDWSTWFTADQLAIITQYRQDLRDVPDHPTIPQIVMPPCPPFIQE